ncbi:RICIN domain-containing protein [Glaciimonas immobilis]|uniref:Ricin B lectin domain-containing protein n=1 Tax=Glaciimonas immobilis TaxID=728004 RepID=A0A840RWK8_9BURK|nr:RICIN domain-containing protein [Glaciimonas immobilis]KAF3997220.1 RICIN domain-containing protein [Glaciimonas immobilis]MBB5202265.1 hypothetical protein [Glaciimonas immobilis]
MKQFYKNIFLTGGLASLLLILSPAVQAKTPTTIFVAPDQIYTYVLKHLPVSSIKTPRLNTTAFEPISITTEIDGQEQTIRVERQLNVRVKIQGVDQAITTYSGKQGELTAVVILRDRKLVIVSPNSEGSMQVSTLQPGQALVVTRTLKSQKPPEGLEAPSSNDPHLPDATTIGEVQPELRPVKTAAFPDHALLINVAIHNDVTLTAGQVYDDYFSWWSKEVLQHVSSMQGILLSFWAQVPEVTDVDYKASDSGISYQIARDALLTKVSEWADGFPVYQSKFMLFTNDRLNSSYSGLGLTTVGGRFVIASGANYQTAAAMLGWMLGGHPDYAEVQYNGWWCETIMTREAEIGMRGNCYTYSNRNRADITAYWAKEIREHGVEEFVVQNVETGLVLDVHGQIATGAVVGGWKKYHTMNQLWKYVPQSPFVFRLASQAADGLCLSVYGAEANSADLQPCDSGYYGMDFTFQFKKAVTAVAHLKNLNTGLFLSINADNDIRLSNIEAVSVHKNWFMQKMGSVR